MTDKVEITSPLCGEVLPLSEVKDAAFASGALGKGLAIAPSDGLVVAPFDATVTTLFPSLHAIGLTGENGVELLIHIGIDTVQLNGEGFKAFVKQGDHVKRGDKLVEFDLAGITGKGYCVETPLIITNTAEYLDVLETSMKTVDHDTRILTVIK